MKKIFCFTVCLIIFTISVPAQIESIDSTCHPKEIFSTLPQTVWRSAINDNLDIELTSMIYANNDTCYYFEVSYISNCLTHRIVDKGRLLIKMTNDSVLHLELSGHPRHSSYKTVGEDGIDYIESTYGNYEITEEQLLELRSGIKKMRIEFNDENAEFVIDPDTFVDAYTSCYQSLIDQLTHKDEKMREKRKETFNDDF